MKKKRPLVMSESDLLGSVAKDRPGAPPLRQKSSACALSLPDTVKRLPDDVQAVVNDGDVWLIYTKPD